MKCGPAIGCVRCGGGYQESLWDDFRRCEEERGRAGVVRKGFQKVIGGLRGGKIVRILPFPAKMAGGTGGLARRTPLFEPGKPPILKTGILKNRKATGLRRSCEGNKGSPACRNAGPRRDELSTKTRNAPF